MVSVIEEQTLHSCEVILTPNKVLVLYVCWFLLSPKLIMLLCGFPGYSSLPEWLADRKLKS